MSGLFPAGVEIHHIMDVPGTTCPLPFGFWIITSSDGTSEAPNRTVGLRFNVGWNGNILVMMSTLGPEHRPVHIKRTDLKMVNLVVGM